MKAKKEEIIIRSVKKARQGWQEALRKMAEEGEDERLDEDKLGESA